MLFTTSPITTVVTTPPSAYQPELSRCDDTGLGMTSRRLSAGAGGVIGRVGALMGVGVGVGVGVGRVLGRGADGGVWGGGGWGGGGGGGGWAEAARPESGRHQCRSRWQAP